MSEFAYMNLYAGDLLADTEHLTAADFGSYMLLLVSMWRHGGQLPLDPAALARIARRSRRHWPEIWDRLGPFFQVGEDGLWITQKRLNSELQDARARREKASAAAAAREKGKCGKVGKTPRSDVGKTPRSDARKPLINNNPTTTQDVSQSDLRARARKHQQERNNKNLSTVSPRATDAPHSDPTDEVRAKVAKGFQSLSATLGSALPGVAAKAERPANLPACYSEREFAALAHAFPHVADMPARLAGLLEWCAKHGLERENEAKKAIFGALRKEAGNIALEAQKAEAQHAKVA